MSEPTTDPTNAPAAPAALATAVDGAVLARALGCGAAVVAVLLGATWGLGQLPAGLEAFAAMGALAAVAAVAIAIVVHRRFLDRRLLDRHAAYANDPRLMAGRIQTLLAAAFAAKLLLLVLGVFGLRQAGVKFEATVAFAVAFAAAALVCQLTAAAYIARSLANRSPLPRRPANERSTSTQPR